MYSGDEFYGDEETSGLVESLPWAQQGDRRWAHQGPVTTADSHVYPCSLPIDHEGFCGIAPEPQA